MLQTVTSINGQGALKTKLDMGGEEFIEDTMLLELKTPDPQAQGSAITYARRYSLMSLLGLVGEDDDDDGKRATEASKPKGVAPENYDQPISDNQRKMIYATFRRKGITDGVIPDIITGWLKIDAPEGMVKGQASELIDWLISATTEEILEYAN